MYYYGSFVNKQKQTVTVHIVTGGSRTVTREIGNGTSGLWFAAEDAVEITSEVNDTFDVLLRHSCTIRLLTDHHVEEFFSSNCRDVAVNVMVGSTCVFAGYVEPMAYSQPYNSTLDELELSCIDILSALQYTRYKNVGRVGVSYDQVRAEAGQRTFWAIINEIFTEVLNGANLVSATPTILYDGSKAVNNTQAKQYTIFGDLTINELLFLDDDEDSVWTTEEVVTELLKYLNLHLVQDGFNFYIFSWESVKDSSSISWLNLLTSTSSSTTKTTYTFDINEGTGIAVAADTGTQITVGEVFNRLTLTCETKPVESVVESPLDSSLLKSPYTNRQKYVTELSSEGNGDTSWEAFKKMVVGDTDITYDEATITDWFLQVMSNKYWKFPYTPGSIEDIYATYCQDNENQQALPNWLRGHPGAALLSVGKIAGRADQNDNSVISKVDMTNYLVISVNGSDDEDEPYPTGQDIKNSIPRAVYTGNTTGGVFSPADDGTTNYIVISGSIVLNPLMWMTGQYPALYESYSQGGSLNRNVTVHSRNNRYGRRYTRKYWKANTPKDTESVDMNTGYGFCPFTDEGPQYYKFQYSAVGDSSDHISKVSVLQCMLIIGDKCVVETGTQGQPGDFVWETYKERSECSSDEEYYAQSFSIGFDPKIDDYIIGQQFNIQNNISYAMGIEANGTAIPIGRSDHVSGEVQFMILGPVNSYWGDVVRKHHNFWHGGSWQDSTVPIMVHVENILLKEFEIKVYSDNGLINNTDDDDIVYMSDTSERFLNEKDDLSMKLCSLLTTEECTSLGVSNAVLLSTPYNSVIDGGVVNLYNALKDETVKPEQDYVDSYYGEYSTPHILLEQCIKTDNSTLFDHYTHPALSGKEFFVQGRSKNIHSGETTLTLKEIEE